jgi:alginate O-acetyltransferase complex protein AlgI
LIGWVFFRIENISQAFRYLKKMFAFRFAASDVDISVELAFVLVLAIFFSFIGIFRIGNYLEKFIYEGSASIKWYIIMLGISISIYTLSVSVITTENFNPFIYFRF